MITERYTIFEASIEINVSLLLSSFLLKELARRAHKRWRMDVHGSVARDLAARGVADAEATLPGYHWRDDAMMVHQAVRHYVKVNNRFIITLVFNMMNLCE